jgi:hypothetical protein
MLIHINAPVTGLYIPRPPEKEARPCGEKRIQQHLHIDASLFAFTTTNLHIPSRKYPSGNSIQVESVAFDDSFFKLKYRRIPYFLKLKITIQKQAVHNSWQ